MPGESRPYLSLDSALVFSVTIVLGLQIRSDSLTILIDPMKASENEKCNQSPMTTAGREKEVSGVRRISATWRLISQQSKTRGRIYVPDALLNTSPELTM